MVEFFQNYGSLILTVLCLGMLAFVIANTIRLGRINKSFSTKKFRFETFVQRDLKNGEDMLSLVLSNRSVFDAGVSGIGIAVGNTYFDLLEEMKSFNKVTDEKVMVAQRSFIKYVLPVKQIVATLITEENTPKVGSVKVYVLDNTGYVSMANSPCIKKFLLPRYQQVVAAKKQAEFECAKNEFAQSLAQKQVDGVSRSFGDWLKNSFKYHVSAETVESLAQTTEPTVKTVEAVPVEQHTDEQPAEQTTVADVAEKVYGDNENQAESETSHEEDKTEENKAEDNKTEG